LKTIRFFYHKKGNGNGNGNGNADAYASLT